MSNAINTIEGYRASLAALTFGLHAYLHLFTNDVAVTPDTITDDFVEPQFQGYSAVPLVRWTPPDLIDGVAVSFADTILFEYTGGPIPEPLRGWYVTNGQDGECLAAWSQPGEPFALGPGNAKLTVSVALHFPPRSLS